MAQRMKLSLATLGVLTDNHLAEAFDEKMKQAVKSCQDFPNYDKPRSVIIKIDVTPEMSATGGAGPCDHVTVQATLKSSFPAQKTNIYKLLAHQDGSASFHPEFPDDPDADGLFDPDTVDREKQARAG